MTPQRKFIPSISYQSADSSLERLADWFQSLSPTRRLEILASWQRMFRKLHGAPARERNGRTVSQDREVLELPLNRKDYRTCSDLRR